MSDNNLNSAAGWPALLFWLLGFSALWLIVAGPQAWLIGVLFALLASFSCRYLRLQPVRINLAAVPGFVVFFMRELLVGGWDVARRALHPALPLQPAWVSYPLHSQQPRVRLVLSALVGLLPGTLASAVEQDQLIVHVLDDQQNWAELIGQLEQWLDRLLAGDR